MYNKTISVKIGGFRYTNNRGQRTKIYVHVGIQEDDSETVLIDQYILSDVLVYGWKPVKSFNGKTLYYDQIHIKLITLHAIIDMLTPVVPEIYNRIRNQINQKHHEKATNQRTDD